MTGQEKNILLRELPSVNKLLQSPAGREWVKRYGHPLVTRACNETLNIWRQKILHQEICEAAELEKLSCEIKARLSAFAAPHLKRVVNATGIILHTNLGRAVLSEKAQRAVLGVAACYSNLEYDLTKGSRGSRYAHVEDLLLYLTGASGALVVNNNAAAVLLVINTLAAGQEVVVSRGELVEIGGSFRIPEVLKMGGAKLIEVGTTNRTHLEDYRRAVGLGTGLILKVHTSNFRVMGFTKSVEREELVKLAREAQIPLVEDLGSGSLVDVAEYGLQRETIIPRIISQGVDVVTFSGDKLLGGPQAGIIAGKEDLTRAMKKNQLIRALRADKLTLAALEATLREYLSPERALHNIPVYRMLTKPLEELKTKADKIAACLLPYQARVTARVIGTKTQMGGGSTPAQEFGSYGIALSFTDKKPQEVERVLRELPIPVIGYLEKDLYILDMRTLLPGDEKLIVKQLVELIQGEVGTWKSGEKYI